MSILDAIANPRMADIAGALDVREARIMRDEARRKEIKLGQLVAEALPGIEKDSPLYELAKNNPREYMAFSKAIGIPMNNGEMMQEFVTDTMMLHSLAQQDPQQAYEWSLQQAEERKKMGRSAAHLEKFVSGMEDDPIRTITGLNLAYGGLTREQAMEERKLAMQERGLDIQEKRLAQQDKESATPYFTPIQTAEGVYAFDARKGTISPAADQEGGMVVGDRADVDLQGRLAKSKTGGSESAKREMDSSKAVSKANQMLSLIDSARELLPKATGSGLGTMRDKAGRLVGVSTEKSEVSTQLEAIGGWMVSNVPRMEGPQSNFDVQNYMTMAAKVGDSTIPIKERMAALDTLEKLQKKYAEINQDVVSGGVGQTQSQSGQQFTGKDQQAYEWAQANPSDPRAAQILQRLGVK